MTRPLFPFTCLSLAALATIVAPGCGNDSTDAVATPNPDSTSPDSGSTASPDGGGSSEQDAATALVMRTSATCGSVPILAPDFPDGAIPDECVACMNDTCCSQATDCGNDQDCIAVRECIAKCADDACSLGCRTKARTAAETAFIDCRGSCAPCVDRSCIGKSPPAPATETLEVRMKYLLYGGTNTPVDGAKVRICALTDIDCAAPLGETTTDADGNLVANVPLQPGGAAAYLEVTSPAIEPTLQFLNNYRAEDITGYTSSMLDPSTAAALRGAYGAPEDPTRGLIIVSARSCGSVALSGVKFASSNADAETVQGYTVSGLPSADATMTDGKGAAGHIVNHPPGPTTITLTDAVTGSPVGSADVIVRAGWLTGASVALGAR